MVGGGDSVSATVSLRSYCIVVPAGQQRNNGSLLRARAGLARFSSQTRERGETTGVSTGGVSTDCGTDCNTGDCLHHRTTGSPSCLPALTPAMAAAMSPSSSPRLPSPPPMAEDQIGPLSPTAAMSEEKGKLGGFGNVDHGASRRIRPGTKAADMAEGPPLVELSEVSSVQPRR